MHGMKLRVQVLRPALASGAAGKASHNASNARSVTGQDGTQL